MVAFECWRREKGEEGRMAQILAMQMTQSLQRWQQEGRERSGVENERMGHALGRRWKWGRWEPGRQFSLLVHSEGRQLPVWQHPPHLLLMWQHSIGRLEWLQWGQDWWGDGERSCWPGERRTGRCDGGRSDVAMSDWVMLNFLEASSAAVRAGEAMQTEGVQQHRLVAWQKVPGIFPWTEEKQRLAHDSQHLSAEGMQGVRKRERERRQSEGRVLDWLWQLRRQALPRALPQVGWRFELAGRREGKGAEGERRTALGVSAGIARQGDDCWRECGGG